MDTGARLRPVPFPKAQSSRRAHAWPARCAPAPPCPCRALLLEAMRGKDMVALARIVLAKRERVMMIEPWEKGLVATALRYPYEIRDTKEYFDEIPGIKVAPDMLKLAEHILKTKTEDFDPSRFVDHYEEAVVDMLKKKQAGIALPKGEASEPPRNVINLMDALRKSVASEKAE